ncbi:MAG: DMT family transporter [Parvularculaceae bacterium]
MNAAASHPSRQRLTGLLLAAGGAALFSFKGIVMKLAFQHGGDVETMMAIRMALAFPAFAIVGFISARRAHVSPAPRDLGLAAALGLLGYYVCSWLDFTGLQYISAQLERLVLFLYPTVTALFAWIFLKDRVTFRHAIALALSYAGVAVLALREYAHVGPDTARGAALVFSAAVLFAVYVTAAKPVIMKLGSPLFTSTVMTSATVAILIHFAVKGGAIPSDPALWAYGAALAVFCTVAPSFMLSEAIGRIGPGLTSAVGGFGPAATAAFAVMLLGEPFGWAQALALVLTVAGVMTLAGGPKPKPAAD